MAKSQAPNNELKIALLNEHFYYEVTCVRDTFYCIQEKKWAQPNGRFTIDNRLLVDFLVHVRILYEFFYETGKKDTSYATDFIKNWKVKEPLEGIKKWKIQINNYLSHLTYTRVTQAEGKHSYELYPVDVLYYHFRNLTIEFLSNIPKEYALKFNLKDLLEKLKEENASNRNHYVSDFIGR